MYEVKVKWNIYILQTFWSKKVQIFNSKKYLLVDK